MSSTAVKTVKHTPTPWQLSNGIDAQGRKLIIDNSGHIICRVGPTYGDHLVEPTDNLAPRDANADHILVAANSHDALVSCIMAVRSTPCPNDTDGDGDCGRPLCPYCGERIRAALSLATKE